MECIILLIIPCNPSKYACRLNFVICIGWKRPDWMKTFSDCLPSLYSNYVFLLKYQDLYYFLLISLSFVVCNVQHTTPPRAGPTWPCWHVCSCCFQRWAWPCIALTADGPTAPVRTCRQRWPSTCCSLSKSCGAAGSGSPCSDHAWPPGATVFSTHAPRKERQLVEKMGRAESCGDLGEPDAAWVVVNGWALGVEGQFMWPQIMFWKDVQHPLSIIKGHELLHTM